VRAKHRADASSHDPFAQTIDKDFLRLEAEKTRLLACGLKFLALAEIGGEGDDLATIRGLQPLQDDRGIEPAGIGEHDFFHPALLRGALGQNTVRARAGPPPRVARETAGPPR